MECCKKNLEKYTTLPLADSPLLEDLEIVLRKRSWNKYYVGFMGFLQGCFLPFFGGWLLLDGFKVIYTYAVCPATTITSFTPIGPIVSAIIAITTLLLGLGYGVYFVKRDHKAHKERFNVLEAKVTALKNSAADSLILNATLQDYDRILRRFSDEQPNWTYIKKALNRLVVVIKRLGTGSLVFRLVIWGPAFTIVTVATTLTSVFFSTVLITGTAIGAIAIASWSLYSYNLESKITQAGRVTDYLVQSAKLFQIDKLLSKISAKPDTLAISYSIGHEATTDEQIVQQNPTIEKNKAPKNINLMFLVNRNSNKETINENCHKKALKFYS